MTCQAEAREALTFLAVGTLPLSEQATTLGHLDTCPACRQEWPTLEALVRGLRELHLAPAQVVAAAVGEDPDH